MKRILPFAILFLIVGCQNANAIDHNATDKDITSEVTVQHLITGIDNLNEAQERLLEISYLDGAYVQTSAYFADRILEMLLRNSTRESIEKMDEYQLILHFDGYEEIYVNIENQNFWFKNAAVSYDLEGIAELWDRYIIKIDQNEFVYDDFEKTVLTEINADIDHDGIQDDILLYYDNDLRLSVNNTEVVINANIGKFSLGSGNEYYSGLPTEIAHLEYIESLDILLYSYDGASVHGPFTNIAFYKYVNGTIQQLKYDVTCDIETIDLDNGIIELHFPPTNRTYQLRMSEREIQESKAFKAALDLDMDASMKAVYEEDVKHSILLSREHAIFEDYDGDHTLELIIMGKLQTKFASAYIRIDEPIVLVYELYPDEVMCSDIFFEHDGPEAQFLFDYFR
ncbi:hypothetical protein KHM83_17465 [Fusibacter paucivorans]|uniref:Uncharacterized protein n=1 Tax=Fusibacter paucivorans TaxID=76009 RepID=A0ABS5PTH7_9FIRM|nr:hypothetical protein [Fusibacter paucivorans]MBS7528479.1 hypothetical protein [Fusibacter paucivorans]